MATETDLAIVDVVMAALVECAPLPPQDVPDPILPAAPCEDSPIAQAMIATLEQTGAGPPPEGRR